MNEPSINDRRRIFFVLNGRRGKYIVVFAEKKELIFREIRNYKCDKLFIGCNYRMAGPLVWKCLPWMTIRHLSTLSIKCKFPHTKLNARWRWKSVRHFHLQSHMSALVRTFLHTTHTISPNSEWILRFLEFLFFFLQNCDVMWNLNNLVDDLLSKTCFDVMCCNIVATLLSNDSINANLIELCKKKETETTNRRQTLLI